MDTLDTMTVEPLEDMERHNKAIALLYLAAFHREAA
jgi:hypothetical protein